MKTNTILEKLRNCPEGQGWNVLIWKNNDVATFLGKYSGEMNGDHADLVLRRDDFGDLEDWESNADLWTSIEELCENAGIACERV